MHSSAEPKETTLPENHQDFKKIVIREFIRRLSFGQLFFLGSFLCAVFYGGIAFERSMMSSDLEKLNAQINDLKKEKKSTPAVQGSGNLGNVTIQNQNSGDSAYNVNVVGNNNNVKR